MSRKTLSEEKIDVAKNELAKIVAANDTDLYEKWQKSGPGAILEDFRADKKGFGKSTVIHHVCKARNVELVHFLTDYEQFCSLVDPIKISPEDHMRFVWAENEIGDSPVWVCLRWLIYSPFLFETEALAILDALLEVPADCDYIVNKRVQFAFFFMLTERVYDPSICRRKLDTLDVVKPGCYEAAILHVLAEKNQYDLIVKFLARNIDYISFWKRDSLGRTPLMIALQNGCTEICKLLARQTSWTMDKPLSPHFINSNLGQLALYFSPDEQTQRKVDRIIGALETNKGDPFKHLLLENRIVCASNLTDSQLECLGDGRQYTRRIKYLDFRLDYLELAQKLALPLSQRDEEFGLCDSAGRQFFMDRVNMLLSSKYDLVVMVLEKDCEQKMWLKFFIRNAPFNFRFVFPATMYETACTALCDAKRVAFYETDSAATGVCEVDGVDNVRDLYDSMCSLDILPQIRWYYLSGRDIGPDLAIFSAAAEKMAPYLVASTNEDKQRRERERQVNMDWFPTLYNADDGNGDEHYERNLTNYAFFLNLGRCYEIFYQNRPMASYFYEAAKNECRRFGNLRSYGAWCMALKTGMEPWAELSDEFLLALNKFEALIETETDAYSSTFRRELVKLCEFVSRKAKSAEQSLKYVDKICGILEKYGDVDWGVMLPEKLFRTHVHQKMLESMQDGSRFLENMESVVVKAAELGVNDADRASALYNLALAQDGADTKVNDVNANLEKVRQHFEECLRLYENFYNGGPNTIHPAIADTLTAIGVVFQKSGDVAEHKEYALSARFKSSILQRRALKMLKRIFKCRDHADVAAALNNVSTSIWGIPPLCPFSSKQAAICKRPILQKAVDMYERLLLQQPEPPSKQLKYLVRSLVAVKLNLGNALLATEKAQYKDHAERLIVSGESLHSRTMSVDKGPQINAEQISFKPNVMAFCNNN